MAESLLKLDESVRIVAWRADRAKAADDAKQQRLRLADQDRDARMAAFEADRDKRIEQARIRREAEIAEIDAARLASARARLAGLEDLSPVEHELRRRRRLELRLTFLRLAVFVALPVVLATLYAAFVATPIYTSTAIFSVSRSNVAAAASLAAPGDPGLALQVAAYVESPKLAQDMPGYAAFIAQFFGPDVDPVQRARLLPWFGTDVGDIFNRHVAATTDKTTGYLTLRVDGRSPEAANQASWQILRAIDTGIAGATIAGAPLVHISFYLQPAASLTEDKSKYTKNIALIFVGSIMLYVLFTVLWTNLTYYAGR